MSGGSYTHYCHLEEQSRVPPELSHFTPCLDHSTPPLSALTGSTVVDTTNTCREWIQPQTLKRSDFMGLFFFYCSWQYLMLKRQQTNTNSGCLCAMDAEGPDVSLSTKLAYLDLCDRVLFGAQ